MTKEARKALLQDRYNKLNGTEKNIKSPGVVRKLRRRLVKGNY